MKPKPARIRLGSLLGKKVFDSAGRYAGRIEEVRARDNPAGECIVQEYLLGGAALMERLSVPGAAAFLIRFLGARRQRASSRVPWHQMDLSDPSRPRLTCPKDELLPME